jgi:hypothetical protein
MINLRSVVAFFHKAKWTERAITHEMNRVLGENSGLPFDVDHEMEIAASEEPPSPCD